MLSNEADRLENSSKRRLKILVVDDDDLNRRMMRILLTREGHDVQLVANGVEAVDAVKSQWFDVVFMDLQMPIMDGFEASRQIRDWENGNRHTYIVALTASYLPEEGYLLFEAGIDNYISKPFAVEHIKRMLAVIARSDHGLVPESPAADEDGSANPVVLNLKKGLQQVGGDLETYRELITDFLQELPGRIRSLEQLFEARNLDLLAREAHNLKGVSSNLGATELAGFAAKLDKQSIEGYTDDDRDLILDIKRAVSNLQSTASDFLKKKDKIVASQ